MADWHVELVVPEGAADHLEALLPTAGAAVSRVDTPEHAVVTASFATCPPPTLIDRVGGWLVLAGCDDARVRSRGPSGGWCEAWVGLWPDGLEVLGARIQPRGAFGSGYHATTTTTLDALLPWLDEADRSGAWVLDVGCGTGLLAVLCAQRGARVVALDLSAAAVDDTVHNAALNGVADRIATVHGGLERVRGRFDLVVANFVQAVTILDPLLERTGAELILGGVRPSAERRVNEHPALEVLARAETDGWIAVRVRRRPM